MKELIKITQHNGDSFFQRENYIIFQRQEKFFGAWINERIEQFGFIENQDYVFFPKLEKTQKEDAQ